MEGEAIDVQLAITQGKGHVFEGGIRIPLIVRGPGVRKGAVDDTPVNSLDQFSALSELAGISAPAKTDGRSYVPFLRSKTSTAATAGSPSFH